MIFNTSWMKKVNKDPDWYRDMPIGTSVLFQNNQEVTPLGRLAKPAQKEVI